MTDQTPQSTFSEKLVDILLQFSSEQFYADYEGDDEKRTKSFKDTQAAIKALVLEEVEQIILLTYDVKAGNPLISKEKALKYKIVQAQLARLRSIITKGE